MKLTPFIAISTDALKSIRKKGRSFVITKHRSAGRYGYSGDKLEILFEIPANTEDYILVETDGLKIYLSSSLSVENYEQINVWMKTQYGFLKKINARVTLYRRLVP